MGAITRTTCARVGLLGNPADVYGGRALGFAFRDFAARVTLEDAEGVVLAAGAPEELRVGTWREAVARLGSPRLRGAAELLAAALARFASHCRERSAGPFALEADDPRHGFRMAFTSDIPRQVGLAGSSAAIVAALGCLEERFGVPLTIAERAELALAAEVEELSITAGPLDRVVQSHGGFLYMDFEPPRTDDSWEELDPSLLPPLFVAWDPHPGPRSSVAHDRVRERYERRDPEVREAIRALHGFAEAGLACLRAGDVPGFQRIVDRNFDTRARIWILRESDREMIALGRARGAAVKFTGSGGAVLGVMREEAEYPALREAYLGAGYRILRPRIGRSEEGQGS